MRTTQKSTRALVIHYEPAVLKEWPTGWQIEYRVLNPYACVLEKRRIRFEKIRKRLGNDAQCRRYAKKYCDELNRKLSGGWSPMGGPLVEKTTVSLKNALALFIREKEMEFKNGNFRPDSFRQYKSWMKIFTDWGHPKNMLEMELEYFGKNAAVQYLDYIYLEKQLSGRTYNNYLMFMRTVWTWFIEKGYTNENPFLKIKAKPKQEKQRIVIPSESSERIMAYFRKHMPTMELVCGLVYNSFMRPSEICRTQLKDIHLSDNGIYLTGAKTKNKHARWCLLPPHLINMLQNMHLQQYPSDYYLISVGLKPGKEPVGRVHLERPWERMRDAIQLPKTMKLYSYRDTGITDMKLAGHSNLFISSITGHRNSDEIETYTHAPDKRALEHVINKSKQLGE
ncbi:MAG: tyrosine-type recombinase/integrase [Tannerellaceae bacterium]|jgi:integrase|nr:tyrosine-type recombinase/integrase [Tannerellaceae bacterium]